MADPTLRVRRATPADRDQAVAIVFETLRSYGIEPEPEGLDADVMRLGYGDHDAYELVAELDGVVCGVSALSPRGEGEGWVSKVFVDPRFRRRGAAKALMADVVREGAARGYRRLRLQTRTIFREAVTLYETTGWTRAEAPCSGPCDRSYFLDLRPR
ncbi:MAG TPA: GNAT family N-acetyltransferase [Polyangiaceae bacterium]